MGCDELNNGWRDDELPAQSVAQNIYVAAVVVVVVVAVTEHFFIFYYSFVVQCPSTGIWLLCMRLQECTRTYPRKQCIFSHLSWDLSSVCIECDVKWRMCMMGLWVTMAMSAEQVCAVISD